MIPLAAFLTPPAALIAFFILAAVKIVVPITHKIVPAHFVTCQNDGSATTGKAAKGIIAAIKASKKLGGKWWTKIKWSDFGSGLAGFGADLIGISDIRSNCSF